MTEENKFEYIGVPFFLGNQTIGVLSLYQRHWCLEELWQGDCVHRNNPALSAKMFVNQMQEHWSPAFLMALRKEITNQLKEHDKEFGTNFSAE